MNKNFIVVLTLFLSLNLFAQENDGRRFSATAILGMNAAQIEGDQEQGFDKIGLNIGAKAAILLAKRWEVGFEILFSQQGSQSGFIRGVPRKYYCHLNYIEVPVLATFKDWKITDASNRTFYRFQASAGLSYNRLMAGKLEQNGILEFQGLNELVEIGKFRQQSILLFGDISFYLTKNWGLNLRFSQGPMNIRKNIYFVPRMLAFRVLFTL